MGSYKYRYLFHFEYKIPLKMLGKSIIRGSVTWYTSKYMVLLYFKGLSAKITFDTETIKIPMEITSELENIREIQSKINEIVTEKITELESRE